MPSYSGLWNGVYGVDYATLGTNNTKELNGNIRRRLSKLIARERGGRKLAAIMKALNGAAPGGTITVNYAQVANASSPGQAVANGGARTITTVADMNRASTAADETMIDAILDQVFAPSSYPVDKSGNGGGSKLGRGA